MNRQEHTEVCIFSPRANTLYLKLLKAALKASIFKVDSEEDDFDNDFKDFFVKFFKSRLNLEKNENEIFLTRNVKNSMINSSSEIFYLIYTKSYPHNLLACNFQNKINTLNTGVSTLIRNVCRYMHLAFIIDLGSLLWFSELYDDIDQLGESLDEFLTTLENILNGVSKLLDYLEYASEKVEVKFSIFLFGSSQDETLFKLMFYEIPIISWITETQLFIENLKNEIQQIIRDHLEFEQGKAGCSSGSSILWGFEILRLLNSFSVSFTHSLIIITSGVISSRLFSEGNSFSLVSKNNYLLHYCSSNDIRIHFLVINRFKIDIEESEVGLIPSLDTLEFIANSCNSTVTICESGVSKQDARKIAIDLLLRSDMCITPSDFELGIKEELSNMKEIYSYKISKKLSVIEILVNKLRNGFNFIGESKVETPLILFSKFHKLVEIICSIENCKDTEDNHSSEFWSIKFYIKHLGNIFSAPSGFSLLKKLLESKEEIKRLKFFSKPYRLTYFLYSFIIKNRLLDTWMEDFAENNLKVTKDIPAFPKELNSLFLPCVIHHDVDLVLESDNSILNDDILDGFKGSWERLQSQLTSLGFKTFILENQKDEYDFPAKEKEKILIYYNLSPNFDRREVGVKRDDLGILKILRSWALTDYLLQTQNNNKTRTSNNFMAIWLKAQRITIKIPDHEKVKNEESQSSIVKFNILFYGFSPIYCQEYTKWFKEQIIKYGVKSDEADLSLLRLLFGTSHLFESSIKESRFLEKSWSYVLWSKREKYNNQEQEQMGLNARVILTISNSRYLDGWILLSRRNDKDQFNSTWYKVRDFQIKDSFMLKVVFIYDLKFHFGNNKNASKLICRTLMTSSMNNTDIINESHGECFSFNKFAKEIHFQDDKILQTISLIDYLYTSSHLRKNIEYLNNFEDEEVNEKSKEENGFEVKSESFHPNLFKNKFGAINPDHSKFIFKGIRKSKEFNKYKRIIQNKSFYGNDDKISLSVREISNLFLTFNNNEMYTDSDDRDKFKIVLPFTTKNNSYEESEERLDKEFIKKFKPLCLIEIPLINAENLFNYQMNSNIRNKNSDIEARRKYLEGASENSFEKFLYKISKITDKSVRVDENEWYIILFIDENDLDYKFGKNESLLTNENFESSSYGLFEQTNNGNLIRRLKSNQIYEYLIITHIKLHRSSSNVPTSSLLGVYLCSYYNICSGITKKKINIEMGVNQKNKLCNVRNFVELYISRVKEIWDSIKFKMISQYYMLGIPICSKDIARIQNENELNEEKVQPSSRLDSESMSLSGLDRSPIRDPISFRGIDLDLDLEFDYKKEENNHQENFQRLLFGLSSDPEHLSEKGSISDPDTCSDTAYDIHEYNEVRKEVCKYLKCNIFRFKLSLSSFKIVLSRKFIKSVELDKGLDELDKVARFIGEELEIRMKDALRVKLIHFDCQDLNCFLVFCGALDLYKGRTENIIVTISLMRNEQNLGISYFELTRFWARFKKITNFDPSWFHFLVWKGLTERDDLELKVTIFTSIDKKYTRVNKINTELWSMIKLEKEVFVSKLRSVLSSWMTDMTMELSFTHGDEICKKGRDESYRMSLFACFGREFLLECLQGVREKVWNISDGLLPGESLEKNKLLSSGSLIFTRDIQFPLLKSTTKFGNDIAVINLLSSQADYVPIKRKPHLVLIWHGTQFPLENSSIENPTLKSRLRRGIFDRLLEHTRVLAEITNPNGLVNNELVLGLALKIYFPSSITTGMRISKQSKIKCKLCDFYIDQSSLQESINFLFSAMQSRFIEIWKEATCDFLLQNVKISGVVSYLMVPKFISTDSSSQRILEVDKRKPEISILDSNEQEDIFGQILVISEWLYEVPFDISPAKFRRLKKNSFTSLLKRKLDPDYYEEPGEVILWDGRSIKVPSYLFWLKKQEDVFIEIPSGLYDAPLIDILFGGGEWDISKINQYNELSYIEKSIYGNSDLGKEHNKGAETQSSSKEIDLITLIYPKGWLLYSEDATTSTNTLGTGSIFLIKPDYLFIDIKNKDIKIQRKKRKEPTLQNELNQNYPVELSSSYSALNNFTKPKSKIGISLSFFGKRKPSKSTKLYFYRQLKFALQRLISNWNHSMSNIVLPKTYDEKQSEEIYWSPKNELSYDSNHKLEIPNHLTLILKLSKAYHNFITASIWNMVSQKNIILKFENLFATLCNILTYYKINYEEIDQGIRIFIKDIDIDSKSEKLNYQIDLSFYSGINGRILDKSDPWAVGIQPDQSPFLNLQGYINDCLLPVIPDEKYQHSSPYWDFNKILEFILLYKNNQVDNINDTIINETGSWNLIRDSNGRLIQINNNLPPHIISENDSNETKKLSSQLFIPENSKNTSLNSDLPIYLMPCINLGADIYYKGKIINLDESNHKINGIILLINSLLNLMFMELLIKLKLATRDNWVIKDNSKFSKKENDNEIFNDSEYYSFELNDEYLQVHGVTIRDIHKYRDNMQNFFQIIINNREAIERIIPLKLPSKFDTVMKNYPASCLILKDINGEKDEVQMYFPSWSVSEFIKIIRDEIIIIQNDNTIFSEKSITKAVISGYTCIIHDTKEIDIEEKVLKREDGISLINNSSISIKFPIVGGNSLKDSNNSECGWHILKYKSQIMYLNDLCNQTDLNIMNWVDSLYLMDNNSSNDNKNEISFKDIYGSFFNISGGKQRPCITVNIHSINENLIEYLIILEFTPSGIIIVCWNVPILIISRFERMIKAFIFENTIKMIWSLQLSIWYKYNIVYRKYIFVLDFSKFYIDFKKNLTMNDQNYYPRICEISTNIISYIWKDGYFNSNLKWNFFEDLYKKELIIECEINRLKLEDIVIPNIVMGKILDFKFDDLLINEFNWYIPSIINKIRILNSDYLIKRWNNYFFKYKLWVFVNQFLIESLTIKSLKQEISKVSSKSIILQVSKSNMTFKYQQIINFLKKKVENYNTEYSKYQKFNNIFHNEEEKESLLSYDNIIQTHYNLLTYLQNSLNIINTLITATVENWKNHYILLHPNQLSEDFIKNNIHIQDHCFKEITDNNNNISSCELCMMNPKDISIRIILCTLFRCSIDVLERLNNEKKSQSQFEINKDFQEKFTINQIYFENLKCYDNKGELLIFVEEINSIPYQKYSFEIGNMYAMKDLTIKLDEIFTENGFIRICNSYHEIINKDYLYKGNYCISIISSIFSGLNIQEKIEMKNLTYLMETEIGTEKEIIIYIKTIHIKKYKFSIPICILISLYKNKAKIIYLTSIFNDGQTYINQSIFKFIQILNIKKLIFEYVISNTELLIWSIWKKNKINFQYIENGDNQLKFLSDNLIKSILWLNQFLIEYPNSNKELNLMMFKIWISRDLKVNKNQLISIQTSLYQYNEFEKFTYRIKILPNSSNTILILFQSQVRKELFGIIIDDNNHEENQLNYDKIIYQESNNLRNELELLLDCFIIKNNNEIIQSNHELKFFEKEKIKSEIVNTLSSIQEYIKREHMVQKIQVFGSNYSQKLIDDITNNQFSINISLENKFLKQLPIIKVENLLINKEIKMVNKSIMRIQENINIIISLFKQFWMKIDVILFTNSLNRIEDFGILNEFLQERIISVAIKHKKKEIILIKFFTTFKSDQDNQLEWMINDIKFTFKDDDKIKRYFLINENENNNTFELEYQKNYELIEKDLFELILKSIEYILDNNII